MAEPFSIKKALDLSFPSLGKSLSVVVKGLIVLAILGGIGLGIWIVVKPHFIKPKPTTQIQNAGVVNQDCSDQVQEALTCWEKEHKKESPWLELRFWKLLKVSLGNT